MGEPLATAGTIRRGFARRLRGALLVEGPVYAEVAADPSANGQALAVVVLGCLAQLPGALRGSEITGPGFEVASTLVFSFGGWIVSAAALWLVGIRLMGGRSDFGGLVRAIGFSAAPQILYALTAIPLGGPDFSDAFGWVLWIAVWALTSVAFFVAAREALGMTNAKASLAVVAAGLLTLVLLAAILATFAARLVEAIL